jgi:hypothetical protein
MKKTWIVSIVLFVSVQIVQAQIVKDSLVATPNLKHNPNSEKRKNDIFMPVHPKFYCVTINDVQIALTKKGYSLRVDNKLGKKTKKALSDFLTDNGIPIGNVWNFTEAFEALGIEPCSK